MAGARTARTATRMGTRAARAARRVPPAVLLAALGAALLPLAAADILQVHAHDVKGEDGPRVRVDQGWLRGVWVLGAAGTAVKFAAFRGIPYAAPPVGPLRFKGPRPAEPWDGLREAATEGRPCPQGHPDANEGVLGDEDCLYLNVYVPAEAMAEATEAAEGTEDAVQTTATSEAPTSTPTTTLAGEEAANDTRPLLPAILFLHGSGSWFQKGSAGVMDLGPELLLQHGVVVVTPSFRLGALGFASLDTAAVPGNAGLKDALAALRWLARNAASFGADAARITVAGHGSGAALAHYLTLAPAGRGLARAAILQSGSALAQWAYTQDHVAYATELAARVAALAATEGVAVANDTADVEAVLLNATVPQLLRAYQDVASAPARAHRVNFVPFVPSPERRQPRQRGPDDDDEEEEEVVLPHDPEYFVVKRDVPSVPVLMGVTSQEALLRFCSLKWDLFPERMEVYNTELEHLLPLNLWPLDDTARLFNARGAPRWARPGDPPPPAFPPQLRDLADQVREEYFGPANVTNSSQQVVELLNDVFYNADVHRLAIRRALAAAQPTFLYRFNVEDEYNLGRNRRRLDRGGAVHTDEMGYLWRVEGLGQNVTSNTTAAVTLRRLTTMWTNFVKTVNPVPEPSELLPEAWPPTEADTLPNQVFLDINGKLELKVEPLGGKHMNFWRNLYKDLRNGGGL